MMIILKQNKQCSVGNHKLTVQEKLLCKKIVPKLINNGLYFGGIDVIGGKLVEENVTDPDGITYVNKVRLQEKVVNFLESKVLVQSATFRCKTDLKRRVEES